MRKPEFSKALLFVDYVVLLALLVCTIKFPEVDFIALDVAWIAQIGVSSAFYYWKAKTENRTKVPLNVVKSLPTKMRDKLDLTEIIKTIVSHE